MSWEESCRKQLPKHLDERGELAPPWEEFPTYEHLSLGWRMGLGESWLGYWHVFLEGLPRDRDSRLRYLAGRRPAPECWAASVASALYPDADYDGDVPAEVLKELWDAGLLGEDVAFETWSQSPSADRLPWKLADTPEDAARYHTRDFWFVSRLRGRLSEEELASEVPAPWNACAVSFATGTYEPIDRNQGLLSLAKALCAGTVVTPWSLGASLEEFSDSFESDMGYVDAFRLWAMSAFDGPRELATFLARESAPATWSDWLRDQLGYDEFCGSD